MHDDDPLWYDRAEPDEPPGPILRSLALTYVALVWLYRVPDKLWCLTADWLARREGSGTERP